MRLYFAAEFSSLADHIAFLEAGIDVEIQSVDIETKRLGNGGNYLDINPRGMVPALEFKDGDLLTENVAILAWIADQTPELAPSGKRGRDRVIEMLSFISSEIHKRFPLYLTLPEQCQPQLRNEITRAFSFLRPKLDKGYLFGDTFSVADAYLFVMVRGALQLELPLGEIFEDYVTRIEARPAVKEALRREHAVVNETRSSTLGQG